MGLLPYISNIPGKVPTVTQLEDALLHLGYNRRDGKLFGLRIVGGQNSVVLLGVTTTSPPSVSEDSTWKGTCDLQTDPGVPTADEWWSATEVGTYTHFGGVIVETMTEVFNYIKWDNNTSTWSVEVVKVYFGTLPPPRVKDGLFDLNINSNMELEVNPFSGFIDPDPGIPYFLKDVDADTFVTNCNNERSLLLNSAFAASEFLSFNGYACRTVTPELNKFMTMVSPLSLEFAFQNHDDYTKGANSYIRLLIDAEYRAYMLSLQCVPAMGDYLPIQIGIAGKDIIVDSGNDTTKINTAEIELGSATINRMLQTDSDKKVKYVSRPPLTLASYYADSGNVGSSTTYPFNYTLSAGTLTEDGQYVFTKYQGSTANNSNSKQVGFRFNGNSIGTSAFTTASTKWAFEIYIIRTSESTVRVMYKEFLGTDTKLLQADYTGVSFNSDNVIGLYCVGVSNDDVVAKFGSVQLIYNDI